MTTTVTAAATTVLAEGPFPTGGFWGPFWIVGAVVMVDPASVGRL
ncbi:hypothetical protein ACTXK0_14630 [Corynebacterium variabile]|nr:hypothetical protein [Corynebacterium neomassiliense]